MIYIFTFESSNKAMYAKALTENLKNVRIIPLPSKISASCGLAIRCEESAFEEVKSILENKDLLENIYKDLGGEYDLFR